MQNQRTLTIAAILWAAVLIAGVFASVTTTTLLTAYADRDIRKTNSKRRTRKATTTTMDTIRTVAMLAKLSQNKSSTRKMLVVEIQTIPTVDKTQLTA